MVFLKKEKLEIKHAKIKRISHTPQIGNRHVVLSWEVVVSHLRQKRNFGKWEDTNRHVWSHSYDCPKS